MSLFLLNHIPFCVVIVVDVVVAAAAVEPTFFCLSFSSFSPSLTFSS